jgi:uncharacterized membrane protein
MQQKGETANKVTHVRPPIFPIRFLKHAGQIDIGWVKNQGERSKLMRMKEDWRRGGRTRPSANGNRTIEKLANGLGWFSVGLGLAELLIPKHIARLSGIRDTRARRSQLRFYGGRELAAGIGILSQRRPDGWLWGRVAGDAVALTTLGTAFVSSDSNRKRLTVATAAVAGITALDIYCGQQMNQIEKYGRRSLSSDIGAERSIVIDRSPEEVYRFWQNFENFPKFMRHVEAVQRTGDRRSHWRVTAPAGGTVEWDAEIVEDRPNSLIVWRTLGEADVDMVGSVTFDPAPGGRGTIVRVETEYASPGGTFAADAARLLGEEQEQQLYDDLRRLKQLIETGVITQSVHPGMHPAQPPHRGEQIQTPSGRLQPV